MCEHRGGERRPSAPRRGRGHQHHPLSVLRLLGPDPRQVRARLDPRPQAARGGRLDARPDRPQRPRRADRHPPDAAGGRGAAGARPGHLQRAAVGARRGLGDLRPDRPRPHALVRLRALLPAPPGGGRRRAGDRGAGHLRARVLPGPPGRRRRHDPATPAHRLQHDRPGRHAAGHVGHRGGAGRARGGGGGDPERVRRRPARDLGGADRPGDRRRHRDRLPRHGARRGPGPRLHGQLRAQAVPGSDRKRRPPAPVAVAGRPEPDARPRPAGGPERRRAGRSWAA